LKVRDRAQIPSPFIKKGERPSEISTKQQQGGKKRGARGNSRLKGSIRIEISDFREKLVFEDAWKRERGENNSTKKGGGGKTLQGKC